MDAINHDIKPLISIVIPIYKVEKYLRFCLDSVQNQTYTKLQILLINDGSPDKCEDICLDYCKTDNRFEYHYKENGGVGNARNYALQNFIKGEFVAFMDPDDVAHPQQIEILYNLLQEHPECSFSQALYKRFSSNEELSFKFIYKVESTVSPTKEAIKQMFLRNENALSHIVVWNKLYRFKDIQGCLFHEVSPSEDVHFCNQYFPKIKYYVETSYVLYFYRQNPSSITAQPSFRNCLITAERMGEIYEYINEKYEDLVPLITQCTVRKYLSTRFLSEPTTSKELKTRSHNLGEKFISLYLKSNDSLKMKFILGTFYYLPFTYRWFRAFMEWKAK